MYFVLFFFQAEDGIRDGTVTGVQTCALPIYVLPRREDVEVQEEHRGPGTFDRGVRRGHGAPLLPLCGAAGEGPGVEQRGRGGRVPLPGAGVEASARLGPAAQAIEWRPRRRRQPDG